MLVIYACLFFLKEPRSCLDVKVYLNVNEDGSAVIYPFSTGLFPLRVFCVDMATTNPKEFLNVRNDGKNFALHSNDISSLGSCDVLPIGAPLISQIPQYRSGHTRFSKVQIFLLH